MKILMVIAKQGFKDQEFQKPYEIFQKNDVLVDIASTSEGECKGADGSKVDANLAFSDVNIVDYSCIVVIGGPGSPALVSLSELERLLHKAQENDIVIASICYAGVVLAKAGVLKGKKATVWNGDGNQSPILEQNDAEYVGESVVVDGKVITANGPSAAEEFGDKIIEIIG